MFPLRSLAVISLNWDPGRQQQPARACVCVGGLLRHISSSSQGLNLFTSSNRFPLLFAGDAPQFFALTQRHARMDSFPVAFDATMNCGRSLLAYSSLKSTVPLRAAVGALFISVAVGRHPHSPQSSPRVMREQSCQSMYQSWKWTIVTLKLHAKKRTSNWKICLLSSVFCLFVCLFFAAE